MHFIKRIAMVSVLLVTFAATQGSEVRAAEGVVMRVQPVSRVSSKTCSKDYFGNTNCSGSIGGSRTSSTCSTDYFGNTNCSTWP